MDYNYTIALQKETKVGFRLGISWTCRKSPHNHTIAIAKEDQCGLSFRLGISWTGGRCVRIQSHNCNCKSRPRWVEVRAILTIILGSLDGLQSHNCKRRPRWVKFQARWTRWVKLVSGISWTCRHSPHNDIIANWPWCRSGPGWLDIQGRGKKLDQWQGFNNSGQATFYAPMKSLRCQSGSLLTDVLDIGWVLQILKLWQGTLTLFMFASLWWRFFITKVWKLHFS